jgi:CRP/FNR family cyclic AMP-dependent transcriptional regulator
MQSLEKPTVWSHQDPHRFLALIGSGRETFDVPRNAKIFSQGDRADSIYFIQTGRVRVTVVSEHGKQATVAILEENQFFGEGCLGKQTFRLTTTSALTPCRISCIEKFAMSEALRDQPSFATFFMEHLLSRNSRIEADVVDQLFNSSEKRLARLLLLLAQYGKEGNPAIIPVTINQETLAEMIGTTRSRVSFFMNKFRENGFIEYDTQSIVVQVSLLNSVLRDTPHIQDSDEERNSAGSRAR